MWVLQHLLFILMRNKGFYRVEANQLTQKKPCKVMKNWFISHGGLSKGFFYCYPRFLLTCYKNANYETHFGFVDWVTTSNN